MVVVKQWSPFPNIRWSSLGKKKVMCFVVQTRELWPIGQSYHETFLSSIDFLQAVSTVTGYTEVEVSEHWTIKQGVQIPTLGGRLD